MMPRPEIINKSGKLFHRQLDQTLDWLEANGGGGAGLPVGGTTGQVLTKQSAIDGDAAWEDIVITGGGA